jgi:hypothetical protein
VNNVMTMEDAAELAELLGLEGTQGVPGRSTYYHEYVARAEGRQQPEIYGSAITLPTASLPRFALARNF